MNALPLNEYHNMPDILGCSADELQRVLRHPTLIHLSGNRSPALFISVLLHGNETTGWLAMRELLRHYHNRPLPRAVSLFIGNIDAAAKQQRTLSQQPDYNRIWKYNNNLPEEQLAQQVLSIMRTRGIFAAVDIHNNTGTNPHYACINRLEPEFMQLATLFGRTVIFFEKPDSVASMAFSKLCPAVTLECGKPGEPTGTEHALEFLEAMLHLDHLPDKPVAPHDINLLHTVAVIKVPEMTRFGFNDRAQDDRTHDISFRPDLDQLNFSPLAPNTYLGDISNTARLHVYNDNGDDCFDYYFSTQQSQLTTRRAIIPSMFTLDPDIIRNDCLGYIMESMELMK
jgi:succinylglutamate desuccinylase